MKILLLTLAVVVASAAYEVRPAMAASEVADVNEMATVSLVGEESADDDDDVVEVQLFVLGAVILTVFVAGTAGYFLRKRLGLTAYTPPADTGHH